MSEVKELVIIGAGPAGIEAAISASYLGVDVTLIDSSPLPGGQYFKQVSPQFHVEEAKSQHQKGHKLLKRLTETKVTIYSETIVWGIFESPLTGMWHLTLHGPESPNRLDAQKIIIAAGAFDSSVPFPGWDLPGIITAGAALTMVKNQRILPGKQILLSGTGPLQMAAAAQLSEGGAEIVSVLESAANLFWRGIPYLPAIWGQWARISEGMGYLRTFIKNRVPYRIGWTIISAHGKDRVQEVVIAKLNKHGELITNSKQTLSVDTVVVGYGLTPCTALSRLINCEMEFIKGRGGFVPKRSNTLETSLSGIYAVGDCAGIGGAELSMIEGRIAGTAAAFKLNYINENALHQKISQEKNALKREQRFVKLLGDLFSPSTALYQLAVEDTIICRCEQITKGEIRNAISYGAQTVSDIKNLTRSGMGNCQGRTCGSIVAQILAAETGKTLEEGKYNNIRPPIHPLPLAVIEEHQTTSRYDSNQEIINNEQ